MTLEAVTGTLTGTLLAVANYSIKFSCYQYAKNSMGKAADHPRTIRVAPNFNYIISRRPLRLDGRAHRIKTRGGKERKF